MPGKSTDFPDPGPAMGHTDKIRLPKKLIVCCDGTWMDSDNGWVKGSRGKSGKLQNPTNVTRISRAIKHEDQAHHPQVVYYQAGVGTGLGITDQILGGGTGMGLSEHVREAYAFVADNFYVGTKIDEVDSIFLIGFSRGAYTARSLGGFIAAVGILRKPAMPYFYECFLDWQNAGSPDHEPLFWRSYVESNPDLDLNVNKISPPLELAHSSDIDEYMNQYRACLLALDLTREAKINAIGVWDTVGALGIPVNPWFQRFFGLPAFIKEYSWFDTRLDNCVVNAFQALALDERRFPYSPALWQLKEGGTTNLKQVWFPGAHSNVGGSYEDDGSANVTLAWMMDQLSGKSCTSDFDPAQWIDFDEDYIKACARQHRHFCRPLDLSSYREWAMGKLYESCLFPQSLAGSTIRTPGLYHSTDYQTGKYTSQPLVDTHEYVHSCVRARIDLGGRGVEYDSPIWQLLSRLWRRLTLQGPAGPYKPHRRATRWASHGPLHWWRLNDGHQSHHRPNRDIDAHAHDRDGRVRWEYVGPDAPAQRVMEEAVMADNGYERLLLESHPATARQMEFSGAGWRWLRAMGRPYRVAHTF